MSARSWENRERWTFREHGYALDSEEMEEGVRCLAAPIFGTDGSIVAGISISGPVGRLEDARLEKLIPLIKRMAREFSESLSNTVSDSYPRRQTPTL